MVRLIFMEQPAAQSKSVKYLFHADLKSDFFMIAGAGRRGQSSTGAGVTRAGRLATGAGSVGADGLAARLVPALAGVRSGLIALRLAQVRRHALTVEAKIGRAHV
jgi:hypothetical protein